MGSIKDTMKIFSRRCHNFWYIYLIFLKIIGLAPVSWLSNTTFTSPFRISVRSRLYNLIFLAGYTFMQLYVATHDVLLEFRHYNLLLTADYIISSLTVFTTVCTAILKQKKVDDICDKLYKINRLLKVFDKYYEQKKIDARLNLLVTLNMCFCLIFLIRTVLYHKFNMIIWLYIINNILVSFILIQYVGLIVLMGAMAERINEQFELFDDNGNGCHQSSTIFSKIEILKELYLDIKETVVKYIEFYGSIMLICIVELYFMTLIDTFFMIRKIIREKKSIFQSLTIKTYLLFIMWDIVVLLSVTFSATKLTSEVGDII